jgi:molecular chaperone DnaK (HSP70)
LRDFLTKRDIPYFVDTELYHAKNTVNFHEDTVYTIRGDGHPTSISNRIVAKELKKIILDPTRLEQHRKNNLKWVDPAFTQLMYYEEMILKQKDWYDKVALQAIERNIPVDSAIYLNARYMLENEKNINLKDVHYFKNQIKDSEEWLTDEQQKATNRSISLDSMIRIDAEYMYNEHLKSLHNQLNSRLD